MEKIRVWSKFLKNINFCQIFEKLQFSSNFTEFRFWYFRKNFDFGENYPKFPKISHFVKFNEKISIFINFGRNLRKISIFFRKVWKLSILVKFSKISNSVKFSEIEILVKFSKKNSTLVKISENFKKFHI